MTGVRLPEQNQVLITGRLTRDPEIFRTAQGTAKCWFSVAVNRNYRDKASGEWKEMVTYVPVLAWREAAERCKEKLAKGSPVHVEGRLVSREFEDKKSGQKRTALEVEARRVQFLAPAKTAAAQEPQGAAAPAEAQVAAGEDMEEVPF
ncbi:MAG: single-stranded DNA-binding protein [Elusimicrobia bacterium]|nr:single-stranded DNA-binding protein [Elusimicrobiota bacterium]